MMLTIQTVPAPTSYVPEHVQHPPGRCRDCRQTLSRDEIEQSRPE